MLSTGQAVVNIKENFDIKKHPETVKAFEARIDAEKKAEGKTP